MPKKIEEEGFDPEVLQFFQEAQADGTLYELADWNIAVEEARIKEELEAKVASECSRLACPNPPAITCPFCGTNYCEFHPPANEPYNTCDKCGCPIDDPDFDPFAHAMAEAARRTAEKEAELAEKEAAKQARRQAVIAKKEREKEEARKALEQRMKNAAEDRKREEAKTKQAQAERIRKIQAEQKELIERVQAEKEAAIVDPPSPKRILEVPKDS